MKNIRISSVLLVFAMFIITGFIQVKAQSVQERDLTDLIWVYIPCANNGLGEEVMGEITLHVVFHFDKDGNNTRTMTNAPQAMVYGLSTGDPFRLVGATLFLFDNNPDKGAYTGNLVDILHFVGKGGVRFNIKTTMHLTENANEEITADFDHTFFDCNE